MLNTRVQGDVGERCAEKYLVRKGFKIIGRKYQTYVGEVDLIAVDSRRDLVFVEVRSKWVDQRFEAEREDFITPEESVSFPKIRKVEKTAEHFLKNMESIWGREVTVGEVNDFPDWRIDLVSIVFVRSERKALIKHFEYIY